MAAAGNRDIGWGVIGCGDVVDRKAGVALRTIPCEPHRDRDAAIRR